MDTIEFILIIAAFAAVLWWYVANARAKSDGLLGLLALQGDPEPASMKNRKSYRIKKRPARGQAQLRDSREAPQTDPTYRERDEAAAMRRRFRHQDEARYRVKDLVSKNKD